MSGYTDSLISARRWVIFGYSHVIEDPPIATPPVKPLDFPGTVSNLSGQGLHCLYKLRRMGILGEASLGPLLPSTSHLRTFCFFVALVAYNPWLW